MPTEVCEQTIFWADAGVVLATTEATANRKPGLEATQCLAAQGEGRRRGEERPGSLVSPPNTPRALPVGTF